MNPHTVARAILANAQKHFADYKNVQILNGTSEDIFPTLIPSLSGTVNFWLDGHYSAGKTFQGKRDTPILEELQAIGKNIQNFQRICVLIDDIRCFDPSIEQYKSYPSVETLIDWAKKFKLHWHIEHDMFVAKTN